MKFYKHLYISEVYIKKKKQIIREIKNRKTMLHTYLLTISENDTMQLEIIHAAHLIQPAYDTNHMYIVGIASDYYEALRMVEEITKEVYDKTNGVDIKGYFLGNKSND